MPPKKNRAKGKEKGKAGPKPLPKAPDAPAVQSPLDLQQVQQFWMSLPEGHRRQLLQLDCDEALERAGDPMAASESGPVPGYTPFFREPDDALRERVEAFSRTVVARLRETGSARRWSWPHPCFLAQGTARAAIAGTVGRNAFLGDIRSSEALWEVVRGCLPDDLAPYLPKGWTFGSTDAERDVAKLFRTALTVILKSAYAVKGEADKDWYGDLSAVTFVLKELLTISPQLLNAMSHPLRLFIWMFNVDNADNPKEVRNLAEVATTSIGGLERVPNPTLELMRRWLLIELQDLRNADLLAPLETSPNLRGPDIYLSPRSGDRLAAQPQAGDSAPGSSGSACADRIVPNAAQPAMSSDHVSMATLEWLCHVPEWQTLDASMRAVCHILGPVDFDFFCSMSAPHVTLAKGAPSTPFPPVSLYSLAVTVLEGAVEGVRQDSLTHELLERAAARLASLPPLPAADPLRDPRPTAQAYAAAAERLEHEFLLAEGAVVNAKVLLEHARGARLAAQDTLDVRLPALNDVKAKIKALTAELDKYTAETQLMARMDVLERREKEEKEQAGLLPEVQAAQEKAGAADDQGVEYLTLILTSKSWQSRMLALKAVLAGLAHTPPPQPAQPARPAAGVSSGANVSAGGAALHASQPPPAAEGRGAAAGVGCTQGHAPEASAAAAAGRAYSLAEANSIAAGRTAALAAMVRALHAHTGHVERAFRAMTDVEVPGCPAPREITRSLVMGVLAQMLGTFIRWSAAAQEPELGGRAMGPLVVFHRHYSQELAQALRLGHELYLSSHTVAVASSRSPSGTQEEPSALMSQDESQDDSRAMAQAPAEAAAAGSGPAAVASRFSCDAAAAASGVAGAEGVGGGDAAAVAGGLDAEASGSRDTAAALDSPSAVAAGCEDAAAALGSASTGAADSGDAVAAPSKASAEGAGSKDVAAAQDRGSTEAAAHGAPEAQQGAQGAGGGYTGAAGDAHKAPNHADGAAALAALVAVAPINVICLPVQAAAATQTGVGLALRAAAGSAAASQPLQAAAATQTGKESEPRAASESAASGQPPQAAAAAQMGKGPEPRAASESAATIRPAQAAAATQTDQGPAPRAAAESAATAGSGAAAVDRGDAAVQAAPAAVDRGSQPATESPSAQPDAAPAAGALSAGPGPGTESAVADQSAEWLQAKPEPMRTGPGCAAVGMVSGVATATAATQTYGGGPKGAGAAAGCAAPAKGSTGSGKGAYAPGGQPGASLDDPRFDPVLARLAEPWPAVLGNSLLRVHRAGGLARSANAVQLQQLVERVLALAPDIAGPLFPEGATAHSRSTQLIAERIRDVCGARPLDPSWHMPYPVAHSNPAPEPSAARAGHAAPPDGGAEGGTAAPATPDAVEGALAAGMAAIHACQVHTHCFQARLARALDRLAAQGFEAAAAGAQVPAAGSGSGTAVAAGAGAPQAGTAEAEGTPVAAAPDSDPPSVPAGGAAASPVHQIAEGIRRRKREKAARKAARKADSGGGGGGGAPADPDPDPNVCARLAAAGATGSEGAEARAPAAGPDSAAAPGGAPGPARAAAGPEASAGASGEGARASGPASGGQAADAARELVPAAAAASSCTETGSAAGKPAGGPARCSAPAAKAQEAASMGGSGMEVDTVPGSQDAGAQEPAPAAIEGAGAASAAGEARSAPPVAVEGAARAGGGAADAAAESAGGSGAAAAQGLGPPAERTRSDAQAAGASEGAGWEVGLGDASSAAQAASVPAREPETGSPAACAPAEPGSSAGTAAGAPALALEGRPAPGEPASAAAGGPAAARAAAASALAAKLLDRMVCPGGEPAGSAVSTAAKAGPVGSGPAAVAAGAAASGAAPASRAGSGSKKPVAGAPAAARGHDASSAGGAAGPAAAAQQAGDAKPDTRILGIPVHVLKMNMPHDIEALYADMGQGHPWQGLREDLRGELRRGHREAREAEGWLVDAWLGSLQPLRETPGPASYTVECDICGEDAMPALGAAVRCVYCLERSAHYACALITVAPWACARCTAASRSTHGILDDIQARCCRRALAAH